MVKGFAVCTMSSGIVCSLAIAFMKKFKNSFSCVFQTGDLLRHKIQHRPDRQLLVQQHILEGKMVERKEKLKEHSHTCRLLTHSYQETRKRSWANSADPDQMPHSVVSEQGLQCLLTGVSIKNRMKATK